MIRSFDLILCCNCLIFIFFHTQVIKWKRAKRPKKPESIGIDKVKRRSSLEKKSQKSYDEATKEAAIKCYLEEGAFACERKHKIPRQSVRNRVVIPDFGFYGARK